MLGPHQRHEHLLAVLVGSAVQSLNAAFTQQGLLYAAWHRARADQLIVGIEYFRSRRPGHADRLLKEDAGFKQICVERAAGLRDESIRISQQGECAVKALCGWYAGHSLSSCLLSRAQAPFSLS